MGRNGVLATGLLHPSFDRGKSAKSPPGSPSAESGGPRRWRMKSWAGREGRIESPGSPPEPDPETATLMREPSPTAVARIFMALLLGLVLSSAAAHAVKVSEVPSPRPVGWSVDLTGRVPKATLEEIDRLGNEVKAKNGDELAVVLVGTTSGVPTHAFATNLFNSWHIGRDPAKGVLVFVALEDRQIEIVVGRGLSLPSLQEKTAAILKGDMVPRLRQGDPGGAVLAAARSSARDLLGVAPGSASPAAASPSAPEPAGTPAPLVAAKGGSALHRGLLALLLLVVLVALGWLAYEFRRRSPSE
jgi:uncharacterized membrane protein YgcG